MIKRLYKSPFLIFLLLALSSMQVLSNASQMRLGSRDGIELYLEKPEIQADANHSSCIEFFIINTNDYPISYIDNARGNRFSFVLLDDEDRVIDQVPRWRQWNDPYASDVGKRATAQIGPGERLEFVLCLAEAYGDGWTAGKILSVKWEPEHSNEGKIPIGWSLKSDCVPAEVLGLDNALGNADLPLPKKVAELQTHEEATSKLPSPVPTPTQRTSEKNEGTSDAFSFTFSVVILAAIILVLVFLFRRYWR